MENPYKSPELLCDDSLALTRRASMVSTSVLVYLASLMIAGIACFVIGFSLRSQPITEIHVWIVFIFGTLFLVVASFRKNNRFANLSRMTVALAAIGILLVNGTTFLYTWYVGTPHEHSTVIHRVFGENYVSHYWLLVATLGILPQLLWFPVVKVRRAISIPLTLLICGSAAFYLRISFGLHYYQYFPSSVYQFFWPF